MSENLPSLETNDDAEREAPVAEAQGIPLPDPALEKKQKRRDFWLGFGGSIVGNILLSALSSCLTTMLPTLFTIGDTQGYISPSTRLTISIFLGGFGLPVLVNIGVLIFVLVRRRHRIVLGMLASYGLFFALALIAGLVIAIVCFPMMH